MNQYQEHNVKRIIQEINNKFPTERIETRGFREKELSYIIYVNLISRDILAQLNLMLISWQMMNTTKFYKPVYAEVSPNEY